MDTTALPAHLAVHRPPAVQPTRFAEPAVHARRGGHGKQGQHDQAEMTSAVKKPQPRDSISFNIQGFLRYIHTP